MVEAVSAGDDAEGPQVGEDRSENPGAVSGSAEASGADLERKTGDRLTLDQQVSAALEALGDRQKCNRLNGCPPAEQLVALGESSAEFVIRRYGELSRPSYQRLLLVQTAGRLNAPLAKAFLLERLHGPTWEERMEAAVGLGRLKATEYIPIMRMRLQTERSAGIVGAVYGIHCGLAQMGEDASRRELREALLPATVAMVNPGMTRAAVECLTELQDSTICALLPGVMSHEDLYLRRESFAAAGALQCSQTDVLLALGRGLSDPVPSAGRQARKALESITGVRFADESSLLDYLDGGKGGGQP